jgi:hypothetical protein
MGINDSHRLVPNFDVSTLRKDALDSLLQRHELTEYRNIGNVSEWCQSGAQAGWGPDLDGHTPSVAVTGSNVHIYNDIFSPRVQEIANGATGLGYKVTLELPPNPKSF